MIRILIVGMFPGVGGVESFIMNYFRNIDKDKIIFDFINAYDSFFYRDEIEILGGKVYNVPNFKRHPLEYYKELKRLMKDYSIVHIQMLSAANVLPIKAAVDAQVAHIIVHAHSTGLPHGRLRKIMHVLGKPYVLYKANHFCACSIDSGRWLFGKALADSGKIKVIQNGIDLKKYEYNPTIRSEVRKELSVSDCLVVGHIGGFVEQKNHSFLIDVFFHVQKEREDSILLLIGDGPLKGDLYQKAKEYQILEKVYFMGKRMDVNRLVQAIDVFVMPSIIEGFPVTAVEAQAAGLPCVFSTNITKEVDLESAVFLDLNTPPEEDWKDMILKLAKNPRCEIKNKESIKKYDIVNCAKNLEQYYLSV